MRLSYHLIIFLSTFLFSSYKIKLLYCPIYDCGYDRTGCMFCMFGAHLEKEPNRFQLMKQTHPQIYDYCINKLGLGKVLNFLGVKYQ